MKEEVYMPRLDVIHTVDLLLEHLLTVHTHPGLVSPLRVCCGHVRQYLIYKIKLSARRNSPSSRRALVQRRGQSVSTLRDRFNFYVFFRTIMVEEKMDLLGGHENLWPVIYLVNI